ncbi:MAG: sulfatase-like hydrolase/transferase, partial [Acidobacteriota bacterium]
MHRYGKSSRLSLFAVAFLCLGTACSRGEVVQVRLCEETARAEILIESNRLVRSNSESRDRWLTGWRFVRDGGKAAARPTVDPAVLEMVSVDPRERTLVLQLAQTGTDFGEVAVGMEGEKVASCSVIDGQEIRLPTPTRRGVVPVALSFSKPDVISVRAVHLKAPRQAGEVVFSESGISQQGWSLVRWTLTVPAGTRLVGSIAPPHGPQPGQVFAVEVTAHDHPAKEMFRWSAAHAGATDFEFNIAEKPGIVRIQLVALGEGHPAVWDLTMENRQPPTEQSTTLQPPRVPKAVVVYVMDALRADSLGCYGSTEVNTPCFDSFSAEGVRFAKHFCVAPSTAPSTRSLFTGLPLQPPEGLPEGGPSTLAERFRDAGFKTGCFTSNPKLSRAFGLVRGFEQVGFEELD